MSAQSTSSRSSMSSASARLYSPELLLQLAASSGAVSSTAASANLLLEDAQRFFADILVESDSSASSRASSRLSVHSSLSEDQDSEEEEEEGEWVYGEVDLRTDLSAEVVNQLRKAVYLALDKPSYPAVMSSSPPWSSSKPTAVLVSTNTANANRLPLVYDNSFGGRITQRRANPGGFFGRPRKAPASTCGDVQSSNTSNADRDSWRSTLLANRTRRLEVPEPRVSKEADSKSWRRMEPGAQWAWNDNAGYVVINA